MEMGMARSVHVTLCAPFGYERNELEKCTSVALDLHCWVFTRSLKGHTLATKMIPILTGVAHACTDYQSVSLGAMPGTEERRQMKRIDQPLQISV